MAQLDDTYCPGAIRTQALYLHTHPDADVVYGDAIFIDGTENRSGSILGQGIQLG